MFDPSSITDQHPGKDEPFGIICIPVHLSPDPADQLPGAYQVKCAHCGTDCWLHELTLQQVDKGGNDRSKAVLTCLGCFAIHQATNERVQIVRPDAELMAEAIALEMEHPNGT